jgi:hypothetical protein
MQAFGISEDDIETVLRQQWARVANSDGKTFEQMASDLFNDIDHGAVEKAALNGGTEMDEQTTAAYEEIEKQLVARGALKAPRAEPDAASAPRRSRP